MLFTTFREILICYIFNASLKGLVHISVRNGHEKLLMCVCGIFSPTHHEMWLGYYPSEFLSFVLLWVARDLFQYLRKHREKSLIYASVALLYAQITPSNATWPLQRMQRRPTTLTVPLQHHLLMRDQLWTPLSKSRNLVKLLLLLLPCGSHLAWCQLQLCCAWLVNVAL